MLGEPECSIRECVHLLGVIQDKEQEQGERVTCRAFPNGIPAVIAYGDNKHARKVKGQTGDFIYERRV